MLKNAALNFYITPKDKSDLELLENNAALVLAAANGHTLVEALAKLKMPMTVADLIKHLEVIAESSIEKDITEALTELIKDLQGVKETINA
jgi:hypothetical protein